jgi:hypothetical protein
MMTAARHPYTDDEKVESKVAQETNVIPQMLQVPP